MSEVTELTNETIDRFLDLVSPEPNTGCWLWAGTLKNNGYGRFYRNGKTDTAHRSSYELFVGPIPPRINVCHKCDVRSCANPSHLFLGTTQENAMDASRKGRLAIAERNSQTKLTREIVIAIRTSGESSRALARRYGVNRVTISEIKHREIWRHV